MVTPRNIRITSVEAFEGVEQGAGLDDVDEVASAGNIHGSL